MLISHNKRKVIWGLMVLVVVILSLLPQDQISTQLSFNDKVAHFLIYFILTFIALLSSTKKHSLLSILAIQILIGICLEVAQSFIPGRFPEFLDVIANSLGVLVGALVYFIFQKIKSIAQN
ncbi:MAG: VanZ family protein [Kordiimonadaceae bacterium]|nr:VanZ family protein [Kordiimonadaceae bacterium]